MSSWSGSPCCQDLGTLSFLPPVTELRVLPLVLRSKWGCSIFNPDSARMSWEAFTISFCSYRAAPLLGQSKNMTQLFPSQREQRKMACLSSARHGKARIRFSAGITKASWKSPGAQECGRSILALCGPNVSTTRLTVGPILLVTDNEDTPTTLSAGLDPFSHLL